MADELEQRLRAADPAPHAGPIDSARSPRAQALVERVMQDEPISLDARPARSRRPLLLAAAAVAAVAIVGAAVVLSGDDEAEPTASVELTSVPEDPIATSCIELTPDTLRAAGADLALRGTVTAVDGDVATLSVDELYVGGPADEVTVTSPPEADAALLGAVPLQEGRTYLVSAADGAVLSCGASGEASADLEAIYESAFG